MISPHHKKRQYEVAQFTEDFAARDWLNEMFDQGYVVQSLSSCVVPGRRDTRKPDVQFTIIMRLQLDGETPLQAAGDLHTLRDLRFSPEYGERVNLDILGKDEAA